MPVRVFVNELSFPSTACSAEEAAGRLHKLIAVLRAMRAIDRAMRIDSSVPLSEISLAQNWPMAAVRNQPECKEAALFLRVLDDRAPFAQAIAEAPDDAAGGPEYRIPHGAPICAGSEAVGLGLAHRLDGISVSLATHRDWQRPLVELDRHVLDADANLTTDRVEAKNAVDGEGAAVHTEFLHAQAHPDVHDGAEIWHRRAELFPNLRFIARVEAQLSGLPHGEPLVRVILELLLNLDKAIGSWRETGVERPPYATRIRRESSSREKYVWFTDDTGINRLFTQHGHFTPGAGRFHFILEEEPVRSALVGHIGDKLGV